MEKIMTWYTGPQSADSTVSYSPPKPGHKLGEGDDVEAKIKAVVSLVSEAIEKDLRANPEDTLFHIRVGTIPSIERSRVNQRNTYANGVSVHRDVKTADERQYPGRWIDLATQEFEPLEPEQQAA
jgi:hypothetical protein